MYPVRLFTADQVEHMYSAALSGHLVAFQNAMFKADELEKVQLDDEPIVAPLFRKAT
jgi:hypothetical protein